MSIPTNSTALGDGLNGSENSGGDGGPGPVGMYEGNVNGLRLTVAFLTLLVWDSVLTLDDMIELFWNSRWNIAKTMYMINRFTTPFAMITVLLMLAVPSPSPLFCRVVPWLELVATLVLLVLIGATMIIRVHALWNRDRRVLGGVVTLLVLHTITYFVVMSYATITGSLVPASPPFAGCVPQTRFDKMWIPSIPVLVFETVVISLIVYKTWFFATQGSIRTPLYTMLFEDGLVYYLVIMASQLMTLVCILVPSSLTGPIAQSFFAFTIIGVACNRLLARLQRLLVGDSKGQSDFSTMDLWSSVDPELTYGGRRRDSEARIEQSHTLDEAPVPLEPTGNSRLRHNRNYSDLDGQIGMEPMQR